MVRRLGVVEYADTWRRMRAFTDARDASTRDELWLCEHPPVYTLGQAGRREHLHDAGATPVIETDRGGQVTWHGPGQVVVYVLVDLRRLGIGIRTLVVALENAVVDLLAAEGVHGAGRRDAPGVYVGGAKVAALGLRVRRGCTYHGLALNVACELGAFDGIDPCGLRGLRVTRTADLGIEGTAAGLGDALLGHVARRLAPAPEEACADRSNRDGRHEE